MAKQNSIRIFLFISMLFIAALSVYGQAPDKEIPPPSHAESGAADQGRVSELEEIRSMLKAQQQELDQMRALVSEQSALIGELKKRVETRAEAEVRLTPATLSPVQAQKPQSAPQEGEAAARVAKIEDQAKKTTEALTRQLGSITFSGDLRLQYEAFYNQLNGTANASNPSILGNELSARHRLRLRARLNIRGQAGKEFDWGLRLASGTLDDPVSTNQVLTDFYDRKPFALDQAYLGWSPARIPGLRIQGGKFEVPWTRTELTIDNDVTTEGLTEIYSRNFKQSVFKNLTLVAWQLPFLERNSGFVRNSNGTVNQDESRRAGKDLALYGAQVRTRFEPSSTLAISLSASDLYFRGTQFISPVQFFGAQLQLPVTITIPASGTTPAQTITSQVTIPRDFLVPGTGLGVTTASTNAINSDGRLSSGYNLVDLIGRIDLTGSKRFPIAFLYNFVINTQTHDVVAAGPNGTNRLLPNNENTGHWAEVQVGKTRERGDFLMGYTFIRLEKDAILTPFNFSDLALQSDIRAQRLVFSYAVDPRVVLGFTGIFTRRAHGLLGAFGITPPGSLNTPTTRLQFDTIFRF